LELFQRFVSHVRGAEIKQFRRWSAKILFVLFHCFISHVRAACERRYNNFELISEDSEYTLTKNTDDRRHLTRLL